VSAGLPRNSSLVSGPVGGGVEHEQGVAVGGHPDRRDRLDERALHDVVGEWIPQRVPLLGGGVGEQHRPLAGRVELERAVAGRGRQRHDAGGDPRIERVEHAQLVVLARHGHRRQAVGRQVEVGRLGAGGHELDVEGVEVDDAQVRRAPQPDPRRGAARRQHHLLGPGRGELPGLQLDEPRRQVAGAQVHQRQRRIAHHHRRGAVGGELHLLGIEPHGERLVRAGDDVDERGLVERLDALDRRIVGPLAGGVVPRHHPVPVRRHRQRVEVGAHRDHAGGQRARVEQGHRGVAAVEHDRRGAIGGGRHHPRIAPHRRGVHRQGADLDPGDRVALGVGDEHVHVGLRGRQAQEVLLLLAGIGVGVRVGVRVGVGAGRRREVPLERGAGAAGEHEDADPPCGHRDPQPHRYTPAQNFACIWAWRSAHRIHGEVPFADGP
jgi:hypothetical protein